MIISTTNETDNYTKFLSLFKYCLYYKFKCHPKIPTFPRNLLIFFHTNFLINTVFYWTGYNQIYIIIPSYNKTSTKKNKAKWKKQKKHLWYRKLFSNVIDKGCFQYLLQWWITYPLTWKIKKLSVVKTNGIFEFVDWLWCSCFVNLQKS